MGTPLSLLKVVQVCLVRGLSVTGLARIRGRSGGSTSLKPVSWATADSSLRPWRPVSPSGLTIGGVETIIRWFVAPLYVEEMFMAHSLSAKKRLRQNEKHRALNRWRKSRFRSAIKEYLELILHGTVSDAETKLRQIYKALDQVAAKGAIHKNTASRYKSRLSARLTAKKVAQA